MIMDIGSSSAFAPPLPVMIEPKGRTGAGSSPGDRTRGKPAIKANYSASTVNFSWGLQEQRECEYSTRSVSRVAIAIDLMKRVQFLRVEAEKDGILFSTNSLSEFESFMREIDLRSRPALFLNDNGNLRAIWKNERREQIALQFLGNGTVQFVIFKQRHSALGFARIAGVDLRKNVMRHIHACAAGELLSS